MILVSEAYNMVLTTLILIRLIILGLRLRVCLLKCLGATCGGHFLRLWKLGSECLYLFQLFKFMNYQRTKYSVICINLSNILFDFLNIIVLSNKCKNNESICLNKKKSMRYEQEHVIMTAFIKMFF